MPAPLIGITTYGRDDENRFRLPCGYVDGIRRAGGIPVLIPPGETHLDELLPKLDGLLLAGGGDLDPAHYGGQMHETIYSIDPERDASEMAIARAAIESGHPTLAICRGLQVVNVTLGGTLHEHVPDVVGEAVVHRLPPREPTEHPIHVMENTRLAEILGQTDFVAATWHHQAVRDIAPGCTIVAHAPDGIIEAFELPSHPWLFAVQWHPELTAHRDPTQQRLFDALVKAASNK